MLELKVCDLETLILQKIGRKAAPSLWTNEGTGLPTALRCEPMLRSPWVCQTGVLSSGSEVTTWKVALAPLHSHTTPLLDWLFSGEGRDLMELGPFLSASFIITKSLLQSLPRAGLKLQAGLPAVPTERPQAS